MLDIVKIRDFNVSAEVVAELNLNTGEMTWRDDLVEVMNLSQSEKQDKEFAWKKLYLSQLHQK